MAAEVLTSDTLDTEVNDTVEVTDLAQTIPEVAEEEKQVEEEEKEQEEVEIKTDPSNDMLKLLMEKLETRDKQIEQLKTELDETKKVQQGILYQNALMAADVKDVRERIETAESVADKAARAAGRATRGIKKLESEDRSSGGRKQVALEVEDEKVSVKRSPSKSYRKQKKKMSNKRDPAAGTTVTANTSLDNIEMPKSKKKMLSKESRSMSNTAGMTKEQHKRKKQRKASRKRLQTVKEAKIKDPEQEARKVKLRIGTRKYLCLAPSNPPDPTLEPTCDLQLTYVHGYNGHDHECRDNLLLRNGELVFNTAGVIVSHNIENQTQRFFDKHTEDVTSIAMHPTQNIMATGQLDEKGVREPRICIWDLDTMELLTEREGDHHGSVKYLKFSPVSNFLYSFAADDDNSMVVYEVFDEDENLVEPTILFNHSTSKSVVFGMTLGVCAPEDENSPVVDKFLTYGKKHLKSFNVTKDPASTKMRRKFNVKGTLVSTTKKVSGKAVMEKSYQTVVSPAYMQDTFLVGGQSGTLYVVKDNKSPKKTRMTIFSDPVACLLATVDGFIATSYSGVWKQFVRVENKFELARSGDFKRIVNIRGLGCARALAYDAESDMLYTGTRRNQILAVNLGAEETDETNGEAIIHGQAVQIEGVSCNPVENTFVTAGYDGMVNCWDLDTHRVVTGKMLHLKGSRIEESSFSHDGRLIAIGTEESKVFLVDYETFTVLDEYLIPLRNRNSEVEEVGVLYFSPDNTLLAVGHYDGNLYLFDIVKNEETNETKLSPWKKSVEFTAAVSHIQWSSCGTMIRTLTRDYDFQYIAVDLTKRKMSPYPFLVDPDTIEFTGKPLLTGWDVQGIFQPEMDGTDINTCAVTRGDGDQMLVCGDDFGHVWLHRYPAITYETSRSYVGHSSFVEDVDWSFDDSMVVSVGGADCGIFVWTKADREIMEESDDDDDASSKQLSSQASVRL